MIFKQTIIPGAFLIEPEKITDDRGFFARVWCRDELQQQGLHCDFVQSNVGFSHRRGTVRGLHFQKSPHAEVKIVRCTRGSIFDVIVDLRPDSATYKRWFGVELTADHGTMIYVPEGMAQGYMTLEDRTEINYHTSHSFCPQSASGVRFDDPAFGIAWPSRPTVVSVQDCNWPLMESQEVQQL